MKLSIPDNILAIKPYTPGKPLEELAREYGIDRSIKLASNENPLGPSPLAMKAIRGAIAKLNRYPDGSGHDLIQKISEHLSDHLKVSPRNIVLGNGSDEIIGMLACALLRPGDEVILPQPSFLMYEIMVRCADARPVFVPLKSLCIDLEGMQAKITSATRMVFLCNPHNPTGTVIYKQDFETFLESMPPEVVVMVDEAYFEFIRDQKTCASGIEYLDEARPLVTLRTFSKAYGLAGLRIGYGIMPEKIAGLLHRVRQPFNANSLAQIGAGAALDDKAFLKKTLKLTHAGLDYLYAALDRLGVSYFPTRANFFLIDVEKDADEVFESMLRHGVIVRSMKSYDYPHYIRINVGLAEENARFIEVLEKVL
ncbi:MAG: histidinol-phosphate transaminase [Desulfobacterales bacterium]|uniref:Histidinol-phosphate aminotransferase n=1 Tax=Candidatus Desulfatibia profunda TaxID=2841695 RepID=A0A8J6TM19_9BACT|nr:histidinol-phosphate transaminase [Candidatus Desulfatibia profunda]MBL7179047.1 histidinol-phosphate transaminase [Desulfobacterales bacterium]